MRFSGKHEPSPSPLQEPSESSEATSDASVSESETFHSSNGESANLFHGRTATFTIVCRKPHPNEEQPGGRVMLPPPAVLQHAMRSQIPPVQQRNAPSTLGDRREPQTNNSEVDINGNQEQQQQQNDTAGGGGSMETRRTPFDPSVRRQDSLKARRDRNRARRQRKRELRDRERREADGDANPDAALLSEYLNEACTYEDLQEMVGECGVWQLQVFLLASFSGFCAALHNLVYGFIGAIPDHWCRMPNITGYTYEELRQMLIPMGMEGRSKCQRFDYSYHYGNRSLSVHPNLTLKCDELDFNTTEFSRSIPMQWNLVCDNAPWASAIQIAYMVGILVGSPFLGLIADWIGRKPVILISSIIYIFVGPLIAFAPNFHILIFLRFFLAVGTSGVYAMSYVLVIEVMSERMRGIAGSLFNLPYAFGYVILPVIAYYARDWQVLQILISAPAVILLVTWYMIPESPRWLVRKGRLNDAEMVFREAAEKNGKGPNVPFAYSIMIRQVHALEQEIGPKDGQEWNSWMNIFNSKALRKQFIILCFCWVAIGMIYYGLALNAANLYEDTYTYIFVGGLLEFPSYIVLPYLIEIRGRKPVFVGLLMITGTVLLSSIFFPVGSHSITYLAYVGKFMIGASYSLVYLYSMEMMPTLVRTFAIGVFAMMGKVGSSLAPVVVDIIGQQYHLLPSMLFGALAFIAGTVSMFLPETNDQRLAEGFGDTEAENNIKMPPYIYGAEPPRRPQRPRHPPPPPPQGPGQS